MIFRWLGIAGIELTYKDQVLLIDPCLTRIPFWQVWFGRLKSDCSLLARLISRADHILVTHAHYDHLLDVPELTRATGAQVYGSENACQLCRLDGVPPAQVHQVQPGDCLTLGEFTVKVIHAKHRRIPLFNAGRLSSGLKPPFTAQQYRLDACFSFWVEAGDISIFDNAGSPPELAEQAEFLCLQPYYAESYYRQLCEQVRPKVVFPNHWDDLWMPLSQPARPYFLPPQLAFPPLRRLDLAAFERSLQRIDPRVRVFVPERMREVPLDALMQV
jgi:L-ascorbate metabolism protein UlaG (beta-lactamase superfamily)